MIEIRELTKSFDGRKAVDNITTTIHVDRFLVLSEAMAQEKAHFCVR